MTPYTATPRLNTVLPNLGMWTPYTRLDDLLVLFIVHHYNAYNDPLDDTMHSDTTFEHNPA